MNGIASGTYMPLSGLSRQAVSEMVHKVSIREVYLWIKRPSDSDRAKGRGLTPNTTRRREEGATVRGFGNSIREGVQLPMDNSEKQGYSTG